MPSDKTRHPGHLRLHFRQLAARGLATAAAVALVMAAAVVPGTKPAAAQPADRFHLELNNVEDADASCRITFLAHNETGVDFSETAYDVVVFDERGVVSQRLILEFGQLPLGKTRVVQFLLERTCDGISRLLINGVEECIEDGGAASGMCLDALVTSSRADVQFGS